MNRTISTFQIAALWHIVSKNLFRAVLVGSTLALSVRADPPAPASLDERVNKLETQLNAVLQENKALREKIGEVASSVRVEAPAPVVKDTFPQIRVNVLSDITFHVSSDHNDKNTFALGDIDPVITAKLSDKAGVLSDFVISSNKDGFAFEVERLLLQYSVNDSFNIEAGRFHTGIGYYTNTYHNGTYFQTATERPEIYLFEDSEGILPIHNNGISVNGDIPSSGDLRLHYVAEVANGRSYTADPKIFTLQDDNSFKAVNFGLSAKPEGVPGLQVGASAYHDILTPEGVPRTEQWIFSAYAVYKTSTFEWLNEGVFLRDTPKGEKTFNTSAAYTQVSQKFGSIRPYVRLQWRNSPEGDPVLALIGQNTGIWGPTVGIRYDFTPMMVLKFEYQHTERRDATRLDEFTSQWCTRF